MLCLVSSYVSVHPRYDGSSRPRHFSLDRKQKPHYRENLSVFFTHSSTVVHMTHALFDEVPIDIARRRRIQVHVWLAPSVERGDAVYVTQRKWSTIRTELSLWRTIHSQRSIILLHLRDTFSRRSPIDIVQLSKYNRLDKRIFPFQTTLGRTSFFSAPQQSSHWILPGC